MKSNLRIPGLFVLLVCVAAPLAGCKSAYYGAYEKFGVYKRDLLKCHCMRTSKPAADGSGWTA